MSSLQPTFVPPTPFPPSAPAPQLHSSARRQPSRLNRSRGRPATAVLAAASRSSSPPAPRPATRKTHSTTTKRDANSLQDASSARKPRSASAVSHGAPVLTPTALKRHLAEQRDEDVTVVKVFAAYCPSCRGAAGPFRKVVAAYADEDVSFASLDFAVDEEFARDKLGVDNLPYFAVFRGTKLVDGAAMGWRGLGSRLVERIEAVRDGALAK